MISSSPVVHLNLSSSIYLDELVPAQYVAIATLYVLLETWNEYAPKYASSAYRLIFDACTAPPLVSAGRIYRSWILIRGIGMLWHSSPVWRFHSILPRTILSDGKRRIRQLRILRRRFRLLKFRSQSLSRRRRRELCGRKRLHCDVYARRIWPIWIAVLHLC
jgi:hypothetical protein